MRRISPWWYAFPALLAALVTVVTGVAVGIKAGQVGRIVADQLHQVMTLEHGQGSVVLQTGETRYLALGLHDTTVSLQNSRIIGQVPSDMPPPPGTYRCLVRSLEGQQAPTITQVTTSDAVQRSIVLNDRRWWPVYLVTASATGRIGIECAGVDRTAEFAVAPTFRDVAIAPQLRSIAAVLVVGTLVMLLVVALAAVITVLDVSARRREREAAQASPGIAPAS